MYALKFAPIYKAKVWGGRRLELLGRDLPYGPIGESWELVDVAETTASGGGGGAAHSVVSNGPLRGRTLRDLLCVHQESLLGPARAWRDGGFPLLVKLLDANEHLSVQVHPSPAYAAQHLNARLKSEAWYIIAAKPGAVLYVGMKPGVTAADLRSAIADNTVPELMLVVPAIPGECHYLPSGTCHALGAGILVAEVQTPSDTTFRVYDWGRTDRELHVEQALACINFSDELPADEPVEPVNQLGDVTPLVNSEYFCWERIVLAAGSYEHPEIVAPAVWMILDGAGAISCGGVNTEFSLGDTVLIPATQIDALACAADVTVLSAALPLA